MEIKKRTHMRAWTIGKKLPQDAIINVLSLTYSIMDLSNDKKEVLSCCRLMRNGVLGRERRKLTPFRMV